MTRVKTLTFTFIVLWFFLVFFRNCLRLPDDMYSVMNITCVPQTEERKTCSCTSVCVREKEEASRKPYSSLALLHVQPVLVELDNVGVFDLHQVLKHLLDLLLNSTHQRWFTSKNNSLSHYQKNQSGTLKQFINQVVCKQ